MSDTTLTVTERDLLGELELKSPQTIGVLRVKLDMQKNSSTMFALRNMLRRLIARGLVSTDGDEFIRDLANISITPKGLKELNS